MIFFCLNAALALLGASSAQAREYHISKGNHFVDGFMFGHEVFLGSKLEFKAAFNETNIYTLPGIEQLDVNKLYGVSDCGRHHFETSPRFGWRWYNNRLEILAVSHWGGTWHLSEVMGVAELNRVYDFKIELSPDKMHYLYTFNHGTPVMMERGCDASEMFGYLLEPYFGGSEASPRDMHLSVWKADRGNFAVEKFGPNPLPEGDPLKLWLRVPSPMKIQFEVFSLTGQLVYFVPAVEFDGSDDAQEYSIPIPPGLSSGLYLVRPSAEWEGDLLPGYLAGTSGEALKIIYLR